MGELSIRAATTEDYGAFSRLFPELGTSDPLPSFAAWSNGFVHSTRIATLEGNAVGYCYVEELELTGYVRHVVVEPAVRRRGVGRALLQATAELLRSRGKRSWALNVRPDNRAAITLYEQLGLRARYLSKALELPWRVLPDLPGGDAITRELTVERDAVAEAAFELPAGQLSKARRFPRVLLEATTSDGARMLGIAVFDPSFPGAFPFRVNELIAAQPLLLAMRKHVPADEYVKLVVENDPRLSALLESVGASVRLEIVHMEGLL
jgi:ribosomal protein S18 acetylase RimI-like enzyme